MFPPSAKTIKKHLDAIAASARKTGRDPNSVRLVVVTKLQPIEVVEAAIEAGAKILGENYPEEAVEKITKLKSQSGVEWHIIGHVQSRKARLVAEHFALFQSLDSLKLAERVDHFAAEFNRVLPVLLEFNVGDEESKSGWLASDEGALDGFVERCERGCIVDTFASPRLDDDAASFHGPGSGAAILSASAATAEIFLQAHVPQVEWSELSMGTSADYTVAVEEGATLVRVGQAILGQRPRHGD